MPTCQEGKNFDILYSDMNKSEYNVSEIDECELHVIGALVGELRFKEVKALYKHAGVAEWFFVSRAEDRKKAFKDLMACADDSSAVHRRRVLHNSMDEFLSGKIDTESEMYGMELGGFVPSLMKLFERAQSVRSTERLKEIVYSPCYNTDSRADAIAHLSEEMHADSKLFHTAIDVFLGKTTPKEESAPQSGTAATDPVLLDMPGFVNTLVEYSMKTAPHPNKVLSFAGALALLAHLAGRKYIGPNDTTPNLYLVALADSGVGKNHPRVVNKTILSSIYTMQYSTRDDFASGQGLMDALLSSPALLGQIDEFDGVLKTMKADDTSNSANTAALSRSLLSLFSDATTSIPSRAKARNNNNQGGEMIHRPSLTIFATAIPEFFYSSLSEKSLANGLAGRLLVFEAGERSEENPNSGMRSTPLPEELKMALQVITSIPPHSNSNDDIPPSKFVEYVDDDAKNAAVLMSKEFHAKSCAAKGSPAAMSIWNRSAQFTKKLAMLRAISADVSTPAISVEDIVWAKTLVTALQTRMIELADIYAVDSVLEGKIRRVLAHVKKSGKKGAMRGAMSSKFHISAQEMEQIEKTLVLRGNIEKYEEHAGNGRGARYIYVGE